MHISTVANTYSNTTAILYRGQQGTSLYARIIFQHADKVRKTVFNRDNYTAPVSHASFKESGAIEYSSDVLLGLQSSGMDILPGESDQDHKARIRSIQPDNEIKILNGTPIDIELKVLKNRNGRRGRTSFHFQPRYNVFWSDIEYTQQTVPFDDGYEDF